MATATRQFKLPDLGEGVKEGQVLRLMVREGDRVAEDQTLMEVETDKAAVEIPSPHAGVIQKLHVTERQIVNVGDLMVTFGDGPGADGPRPAADRPRPAATPEPSATANGPQERAASPAQAPALAGRRKPASPAVRKLARSRGIDLAAVKGSGPSGRITRADVERAASAGERGAETPRRDSAPHAARSTQAPAQPQPIVFDAGDELGPMRREPISQARKTIASVMSCACSTIPHVTDCNDADVTELERLRRGYNESVEPPQRLGMLAFVVRAVVRALRRHPVFNASWDEQAVEIVYKGYYHVAVGVQTQRGLVAPVLRDVDRMSIVQINAALGELIERVRRGEFSIADTRGATYTISNAGAMGPTRYSTPIITPPQAAVLAVGRSRLQPAVVDGQVVPRLIMPLSHSMDHRLIDGAQEIAFIGQVIGDLENPAGLMLDAPAPGGAGNSPGNR